ncbi:MAG: glycosyltransferase family 4 protein [bacterium]
MILRTPRTKAFPVAFIGSYVPRQCGIATFTHDLASAVADLMGERLGESDLVQVIALNNFLGYKYGPQVRFEVRDQQITDYREAADFLNVSIADVVCLQHEFGILGGDDGRHILTLLRNLRGPVVTTLHTVLQTPTKGQLEAIQEVCSLSTLVVVMAERARELLRDIYNVPEEKIIFIHHGVPDVPFLDPGYYKDQFQVEGRKVILTFGLINPNKGIEIAIDALAKVVKDFPDVAYIVLGATHPEIRRRYGEEYRLSLERRVAERGLTDYVIFHNRYVTSEQLCEFLLAADIYVTPYLSQQQIVSGTLAYSLGCGKAIISTPYWYAEEMLSGGRGLLVPFRDSDALAKSLCELLSSEVERNRLRKRAYEFGRQMIWKEVGRSYLEAFQRAISDYHKLDMRPVVSRRRTSQPSLPEVDLRHLRTLTDDTGILQHAVFATPNRNHGYCTDDNARALLVSSLNWHLFRNEDILPLFQTYLSFLYYAFNEERGRFRNFMSYDRRWLEEVGSEDCHGRAVWTLGFAVAYAPNESILALAARMFDQALPPCRDLSSPRAWAYVIMGCHAYLRRFSGASEVRRCREDLARRIMELFERNSSDDWPWLENVVTYANAKLPHALILAGQWINDSAMVGRGLRSLDWLMRVQTEPSGGYLSLIGNDGWLKRGGQKAKFDQQPIEVANLMGACQEAYFATGNKKWLDGMRLCLNWFLGYNDLHEPLYDFATGGCRDGLHATGVNKNQGAESTIAWLISLHRMYEMALDSPQERRGGA